MWLKNFQRWLICLFVISVLPTSGKVQATASTEVDDRYNIIVLMLDDLDQRSLWDMIKVEKLPNFKGLFLDQSVELTEYFITNPLCCPSRATYLTGQYSHNNGVLNNFAIYQPRQHASLELSTDYPPYPASGEDSVQDYRNKRDDNMLGAVGVFNDNNTFAVQLQKSGYNTGYIGKYLNGYGSRPKLSDLSPAFAPSYVPPGWTEWYGLIDPTTYCMYNYSMNQNGQIKRYKVTDSAPPSIRSSYYQTHIITQLARQFIVQSQNKNQPFFLSIMPLAPHSEICDEAYKDHNGKVHQPKNNFEERIRPAPEDEQVKVPDFILTPAGLDDNLDKPDWLKNQPALSDNDIAELAVQYQSRLRSLLAVDRMIGELRQTLSDSIKRTIFIFTSDNGWLYGEHRIGGKLVAYDESAKVPFFIYHPDNVSPKRLSNLITNNDLAPTILEMANVQYGTNYHDGTSFASLISNSYHSIWTNRNAFMISHWKRFNEKTGIFPTYSALRTLDYLYIESTSYTMYQSPGDILTGLELYDLRIDPQQMNSLIRYPDGAIPSQHHNQLAGLKNCQGQTCQQLERGFETPTPIPTPSFKIDDQIVTKPNVIVDPEFDMLNSRITWRSPGGALRLGRFDPETGNLDLGEDGEGIILDTDLPSGNITFNGPEWIYTQQGTQIIYTKQVNNQLHVARTYWKPELTNEILPNTVGCRTPIGSQDLNDPYPRIFYICPERQNGAWVFWRLLDNPASEGAIPDLSAHEPRWVQGERRIIMRILVNGIWQAAVYDLDSGEIKQLTFDSTIKGSPFMFRGPRGELLMMLRRDYKEVAIYRYADNDQWQVAHVFRLPAASSLPYITSPEPFLYQNKLYISMVASSAPKPKDDGYGEIWVAGINLEANGQDFFRKVNGGDWKLVRKDPEPLITGNGVYIYYTETDLEGNRYIRRCATGLNPNN